MSVFHSVPGVPRAKMERGIIQSLYTFILPVAAATKTLFTTIHP